MLGPFTFTFTLESEEFEKFEKVAAAADLYFSPWSTLELLTELISSNSQRSENSLKSDLKW